VYAYVVISLMTGIRTEEARELRWDHVVTWVPRKGKKGKKGEGAWRPVAEVGFDHQRFAVYVWRSVRATGDTKTKESRRTLQLPQHAVEALRRHHTHQAADKLKAGKAWQDHGLVFCSPTGTPLDAANVRRAFRLITKKADIGENWTPRELRHSFVSLLKMSGVASSASFGKSCEHSLPAPQRYGRRLAAELCSRHHRADLRCHHVCCIRCRADASSADASNDLLMHQRQRPRASTRRGVGSAQ